MAGPSLPSPSEPDGHRVSWETAAGPAPAPGSPGPPGPRRPGPGRFGSRRAVLLAAAVLLLVVATVLAVTLVPRSGGEPGSGADRWSVAEVADRYRALGADLLAGASGCAPDTAAPGETERVRCDVEGLPLILRTYQSPLRLREAREAALPAGDVVRSSRRLRDDGAISISELRFGQSSAAWDAQIPRPVGASVTAPMSLVDLATFVDRRRYGLVPRPDVPGPQFRSGALWTLAEVYVDGEPSIRCEVIIPMTEERERVQCRAPDDTRLNYILVRNRDAFVRTRADFADDGGAVPGTRSVRTWSRSGGPTTTGTISQYVNLDGRPVLYYDDNGLGGYGVFFGPPGGSQAALFQFWSGIATPR